MSTSSGRVGRDELIAREVLEQMAIRVRPYFDVHRQCIYKYHSTNMQCKQALQTAHSAIAVIQLAMGQHCSKLREHYLHVAKQSPVQSDQLKASNQALWACVDRRVNRHAVPLDIMEVEKYEAKLQAARTGQVEPQYVPERPITIGEMKSV